MDMDKKQGNSVMVCESTLWCYEYMNHPLTNVYLAMMVPYSLLVMLLILHMLHHQQCIPLLNSNHYTNTQNTRS
jgi:hypothetical protein